MRCVILAIVGAVAITWAGAAIEASVEAQGRTPGGNEKAAAVQNPVKSTPESIGKGRSAYGKSCGGCHGPAGLGDGPFATKDPSPANLADAEWKYGSSDGEIFDIIANGVGGDSKMKGMRSTLTAADMWNIVNFIRSIGPKTN
jgi:mono/diheme cytochrome c family protein